MDTERTLDSYQITVNKIVVDVRIIEKAEESVPIYTLSIANISDATKIILEKIHFKISKKITY